ncbi:hypothetical protein TrVE_jg10744 [Triparma verrucosa]|uniref:LicD/FKTN/FKRP nucleotidyltransferase domain-containing protein n=1 Tax=Triparma verrucosa TaxID=1606542 RepID=A0A9W7F5D2_9STRA|nr:hypothetical protein TrVE_jg10744 [Triparma verrucosa]
MIYAGGQLGAMLHGGPMPWDDDIDVAIEYRHREKFEELCGETVAGGEVRLGCFRAWNAWKVFKGKGEDDRTHWKHDGYNSPYIDVYFVEERFYWRHPSTRYIREVRPDGETTGEQQFRVDDFYPVEDYYYGGMKLKGPGRAVALRYDLSRCFAGGYNHRLEAFFADAVDKEELEIDCCAMYEVGYPFVKEDGKTLTYMIRNKLGTMERYDVRVGL